MLSPARHLAGNISAWRMAGENQYQRVNGRRQRIIFGGISNALSAARRENISGNRRIGVMTAAIVVHIL